jgi:hypothetical protein
MAGVAVVAPALARANRDEMESRKQVSGGRQPPLPGEKAHAPVFAFDFAAQIDELNFCH